MTVILVLIVILLVVLWGLASISQSYAAAMQAEAAIHTSRAAQVSSTGNLVTILIVALLVLVLLATLGFVAYLYYQIKIKPLLNPAKGGAWAPGPNAQWRQVTQLPTATNDLLPALLTMMMYQMLQQQRQVGLPSTETDSALTPVDTLNNDIWVG